MQHSTAIADRDDARIRGSGGTCCEARVLYRTLGCRQIRLGVLAARERGASQSTRGTSHATCLSRRGIGANRPDMRLMGDAPVADWLGRCNRRLAEAEMLCSSLRDLHRLQAR